MKQGIKPIMTILYMAVAFSAYGQGDDIKLPVIGKWLIDEKGEIAHWLGVQYQGKVLNEPINVVIIDRLSRSPKEAVERLKREAQRGGYTQKLGHSADYSAFIDGKKYDQITPELPLAFSNEEFYETNNHGRIMGPCYWHGSYLFVGAFSREALKLKPGISHSFISFNMARDDFCQQMSAQGTYRIIGTYSLGNRLEDPMGTTADHDGNAIVLEAQ